MVHRYPFSTIHPTTYYGQRVAVYFNLHYHIFSLKSGGKSGSLLTHAGVCTLTNAVFEVQRKGRERAIAQGRKNVHAYVVGILQSLEWEPLTNETVRSLLELGYQRVTYSLRPDQPLFYCKDSPYTSIITAKAVILNDKIALALVS
jgi:hypothetical protein